MAIVRNSQFFITLLRRVGDLIVCKILARFDRPHADKHGQDSRYPAIRCADVVEVAPRLVEDCDHELFIQWVQLSDFCGVCGAIVYVAQDKDASMTKFYGKLVA